MLARFSLLLAALTTSGACAASSRAFDLAALTACNASDTDAATDCMIKHLGKEGVAAIRTDKRFDPAQYAVVSLAFRLDKADSPVAASLARQKLYNRDIAPMILIMLAKDKAGAMSFPRADMQQLAAQLNGEMAQVRANWKPNVNGATRVDMSLCPDLPAKRHPQAVCMKSDEDGTLMIVAPNWSAEEAPRGN
jgi:hypothetical protein